MIPALFIGRFQPFHKGHLDAIAQCFEHEEKIIIMIGSASEAGGLLTRDNPFSTSERVEMVKAALSEIPEYNGRYSIIPVPDINDHPKWPTYVESLLPSFGAVYTGSALTKSLFGQYSSHSVRDLNKSIEVSATEVRLKMANNQNWQILVPKAVALLLEKWKACERISNL